MRVLTFSFCEFVVQGCWVIYYRAVQSGQLVHVFGLEPGVEEIIVARDIVELTQKLVRPARKNVIH